MSRLQQVRDENRRLKEVLRDLRNSPHEEAEVARLQKENDELREQIALERRLLK